MKNKAYSLNEDLQELRAQGDYLALKGRNFMGLDTGFPLLNQLTGGMVHDLFIIAGGTAYGKTTFLTQLAWQLGTLNTKTRVVFFSLDQNRIEIIAKLISLIGRVPISFVRIPRPKNDELDQRRMEAMQIISENSDDLDIYDESEGRISVGDIENIARKNRDEHKGNLVFIVDSLQRISPESANNLDLNSHWGQVLGKMRLLARELKSTFFISYGLFGQAELRRPQKGDLLSIPELLRESYCLMTLYCDYINNPGTPFLEWEWEKVDQANPEPVVPIAELTVVKSKMEATGGRLYYKYLESIARFQECVALEMDHYDAMIVNLEEHKEKKENIKLQNIKKEEE